ncbi:MAG: sigma-70 family RNA polymerase sigma factor [Limnochordia bacterium]|jgi:RNA polymerase sporulation-specific sigma factor|nr:sigma-70 family RNA polymerase sigma factor [Bacillota bacterium]
MGNQSVDLQLINKIRSGDARAKEELVRKYLPMIKHIVRNHYASFLDYDDLIQEGMIGLLSAIDEYRPEEFDVKFSSFAYICIIRKIYNVLKHTNGNKHRALNNAISLYTFVNADETRTIMDHIASGRSPEELVEEQILAQRLEEVLKNHLSILEYTVLIFLVSGYTSQEIERELGVSSKVIDNARTRVKSKLSRILHKYGSLLSPQVPLNVRKREDLYRKLPLVSLPFSPS